MHVQNLPEAFEEPLIKASAAPNLGDWGNLRIVAIGPKGGKIVGYDAAGKPIYAGSSKAKKLSDAKAAKTAATAQSILDWLAEGLGAPAKVMGDKKPLIRVTDAVGKLLVEHFPALKKEAFKSGEFWNFNLKPLAKYVGEPLTPQTEEQKAAFAAKAGSGELDADPFPPLDQLKEIPAGVAAGSHGNKLFQAPDGRKFVFKHDNPLIARAEEAADRIARLILGPKKAPAAKHVKLAGKPGVLLEWLPGKVLNASEHSDPPQTVLQKHFDDVVAHHVVDWLISNHDGHAGNFLVTDDGLAAFDKGQAWKWLGEDKLSADYKGTNPSWPIYHDFWNAFQNGKLKGDPVEAARKVLEAADQVSPTQFRQVVAPYAAQRAKKTGESEAAITEQLVQRLMDLRSDWEKFLAGIVGHPVDLSSKHQDAVQKPTQFEEPAATPEMKAQPVEPVDEGKEKPAGWPIQKGPVTVMDPGSPAPPDVGWPKGYPGPGFQAKVTYKGQLYTIEFDLIDGKPWFTVYYPDGTSHGFPSPNAASDSLVLKTKGLPLTLTATEKKQKGISYPAGKAFGIQKFQAELEAAHTAPKEELEEKFDPIAALTGGTMVTPGMESLPNWETMPEGQSQTIPAGASQKGLQTWLEGAPAGARIWSEYIGTAYVKQADGMWAAEGSSYAWDSEKTAVGLSKEGGTATIPETTPQPGPAPKVAPDKAGFDVPEHAPQTYSGPLPPGATKTVTKKFELAGGEIQNWEVTLRVNDDGTLTVLIPTLGYESDAFKSLSMASDHVWVVQKGYGSIQAYKEQTGKTKVPSGGGWKFWGIDPKAVFPPEGGTAAEPAPEPPPTMEPAKPIPDLTQFPVGTKVTYQRFGDKWQIERTNQNTFIVSKWMEGKGWEAWQNWSDLQIASPEGFHAWPGLEADSIQIEKPGAVPAEAAPTTGFPTPNPPPGWARMPPTHQTTMAVKSLPEGTKVRWQAAGELHEAVKTATDDWHVDGMVHLVSEKIHNYVTASEISPVFAVPGGVVESGDEQWGKVDLDLVAVNDMPTGTKIRAMLGNEPALLQKIDAFNWKWDAGDTIKNASLQQELQDPSTKFVQVAYPPGPTGYAINTDDLGLGELFEADPGTEITFSHEGTDYRATKLDSGKWNLEPTEGGGGVLVKNQALLQNLKEGWDAHSSVPLALKPTQPPAPPPPGASPAGMPATTEQELIDMPVDTEIRWTTGAGEFIAVRGVGQWLLKTPLATGYSSIPESALLSYFKNADPGSFKVSKQEPVTVKPPKTTDIKQAKVHTSIPENVPLAVKQKMQTAFTAGLDWEEKKANENAPSVGGKSVKWAGWVPPPAVWIEGEIEGKRYWFTPVVMGYHPGTGEPFNKVRFSMVDEEGTFYHGDTGSAAAALKDMAAKAGLPTDSKVLKAAFNLNGVYFAPGETLGSVHSGSGPSVIPDLPVKQKKSVVDMTPAEKQEPVKTSMTLAQAFIATFGTKALVSSTFGAKKFVIPTMPGETEADAAARLQDFLSKMGLNYPVEGGHAGAYASIPASMIDAPVVVTLPMGVAGSAVTPSEDNWETMPEGVPHVLSGDETVSQIHDWAQAMPVGSAFVGLTGVVIQKKEEGWWTNNDGETFDDVNIGEIMHGVEAAVIAPEGAPAPVKPKPKVPKVTEKTPEQKEAEQKAKEVATWAKANPPVSSEEAIHVLSHFQAKTPAIKLRARMAPDGELLIQAADPEDAEAWLAVKETMSVPFQTEMSPLGGWMKISVEDLKKSIPGNAAGTIQGPDGNTYPAGTTFQTKAVEHKAQEKIEAAVTKIVEHKTDPSKRMVKLLGTDEEQRTALIELMKSLELPVDANDIKVGGQYTMMPITMEQLNKVVEVQQIVEPTVPPQPPRFVSAPLPTAGGNVRDGEEVGNNRGDLAIMADIKPPATGHWVRCGKHGVFWNDQVRVYRVKDSTGKVYHEVVGQLQDASKLADTALTFGTVQFWNAANDKLSQYPYPGQSYDPETGAVLRDLNKSAFGTETGRRRDLDSGTKVEVIDNESHPAFHGCFRVRVDADKDLEAELASAFEAMGVDPAQALADPSADDERLFIKHQLLRSFGGSSEWKIPAASVRDEAYLDERLKELGATKYVKGARIIAGFNGKHTVQIDDLDLAKKAGVLFCYISQSSLASVYARLREGRGMWSNRVKWFSGVEGNAASMGSDQSGGGPIATFARFGNSKANNMNWGYKGSGNYRLIIHPRAVQRTDWYAFDGDEFGHYATKTSVKRQKSFNNHDTSNEINFEDGISQNDIAGVTVETQSEKKQLLEWLAADGIHEVNGIPLDKFVQVYAGRSRTQVAKMTHGLKEGVLP